MIYREQPPSPALAKYIRTLWYCEGYAPLHRKERILPNGNFSLVIALAQDRIVQWDSEVSILVSPALVVGLRSAYEVIDTGAMKAMAGVVFEPGEAASFFDVPPDRFLNRDVPLEDVWLSDAKLLRERLLEAPDPQAKLDALDCELRRRLRSRAVHPAVAHALDKFHRAPDLRATLDTGLSRRRFSQLFREQVGITPKIYCRIQRFQRVLRSIDAGRDVDWAQVALGGGYCDQAHFANEFRDFSGITPGAWIDKTRPWMNTFRWIDRFPFIQYAPRPLLRKSKHV